MSPQPAHFYARALKHSLPADVHEPALVRLWWLPAHALVITAGITALGAGWVPLWLAWLVSMAIGASFAGLTFLGHEALHGAVVRGRHWQRLVGFVTFLPFAVSPRLWVAWHNRVHHGNTNRPGKDPDAFPTLAAYEESKLTRFMTDHLGASRGSVGGALALLVGFTVQSVHMLVSARRLKILSPRDHRWALAESALAAALWSGLAWWIGGLAFVFAFVLPLMIANVIVMAHILTNHSLSPLTPVNDPLLNSLSVTVPRWAEWLTLHFGYHVEHHLFPWMSARHARHVRALVQERWPERYQSLPLLQALKRVYRTGRIYEDARTLLDVKSGRRWPTLTERPASPPPAPSTTPQRARRARPSRRRATPRLAQPLPNTAQLLSDTGDA